MDVLETLKKLPPFSYDVLPSNPNQVIRIDRGVPGYTPLRVHNSGKEAAEQVQHLNQQIPVSDNQREAMSAGSMFGWHVPAADPDTY